MPDLVILALLAGIVAAQLAYAIHRARDERGNG